MLRPTCLAFGAALPLAILSQSATADVTPAEVWSDWRGYLQDAGYSIDVTETNADGELTLSDLTISGSAPDETGRFSVSLGTISFADDGAGGVSVILPDVLPMQIDITPADADEEPVTVSLTYSQTGQSMSVSGAPTKMTYDYRAATSGVSLDQVQVGDETYGPDTAKLNLIASGVRSTTETAIAALRSYEQTSSIESLQYDILINAPEEDAELSMTGSVADLAMSGRGKIPLAVTGAMDMNQMIAAGFSMAGKLTAGASQGVATTTDSENGTVSFTGSSDSSALSIAFGEEGLTYEGQQTKIAAQATVEGLPFPIDFGMGEAAFNLAMPVAKKDAPQDYALGVTLGEFTMSNMLWGIFDPTGQLPRDPATIVLDLSGKATLLADYLDPEAAEKLTAPGATIGEVETLQLDALQVDVAGAELTGSGAVTFDNADTTTYAGTPKPVGSFDLKLIGGGALLDKLTAIGLLPQQQAMGARMMMGLFAVPGDSPDTLNSKIEFTEKGEVLANGQRIR